jgi:hypothetical protein
VGGRGVGLAALKRGNWIGDPIPRRTTGRETDFGDPALTGPQDRIDRPGFVTVTLWSTLREPSLAMRHAAATAEQGELRSIASS